MKYFLVVCLISVFVLNAEDMNPPTQEDVNEAKKVYKKILKIPAELRGIWTGTGEYTEFVSDGIYIESLDFCGEWYIENRFKMVLKKGEKTNITYDVITNYSSAPNFGRDAYWINLRSIKPMTIQDLLFFRNSKKMFYKRFIDGKELESIEYKFERCPSDKK
ncbi:MAG TPA: hypothetical protein PK453_08595 [Leptospiraceae bacterium]|nr:hypothetical protein [Leptospiraceae bacterium]HMY66445.1 hypothetical protein [Leptospiraceae bacterium]HNF13712.1 hypothetical protein [Leptospiraceae bacterium]HNF25867.1 hypothetical protein [Leptospiraceae bacterium]HNM06411.1 hypothetical protein [Leptospiraceae bacterium]